MPTAVVRGDGVQRSADEGGATVVRSKKRRRWIQPVHITIRQSGGTHKTNYTIITIRYYTKLVNWLEYTWESALVLTDDWRLSIPLTEPICGCL